MKCSSCGHENPESAAFCGTCGKKLEGAPKQTQALPGNRKLALPLGVALLLIIGATSFFFLRHGKSPNNLVGATPGATANSVPKYTVIDLGDMLPIAINDNSQVLWQQSYKAAGLWQNGKITNIPFNSLSMFLNNKGAVLESGNAVLWQDGRITELAQQPGFPSIGNLSILGFNDNGQILADGNYGSGTTRGYGEVVWQAGQLTPLLHFHNGHFGAINNRGVVVSTADLKQRFVYEENAMWQNGQVTDLADLGESSNATGINDAKQVIGTTMTKPNDKDSVHAFLWQNGRMNDLGTLPGGLTSEPDAINNSGQIVGQSSNQTDWSHRKYHAFLWQNKQMYDLSSLIPGGYDLEEAKGINDKGQIVAYGKHNGKETGVILTPQ